MDWRFQIVVCVTILAVKLASGEICTQNVCEYHFDIRYASSMMYKGFKVVLDGTRLQYAPGQGANPNAVINPDDVITLDGVIREVISVNGQIPGPTIEIMEHSEVDI